MQHRSPVGSIRGKLAQPAASAHIAAAKAVSREGKRRQKGSAAITRFQNSHATRTTTRAPSTAARGRSC
jgi:hypothetical protein